MELHTQDIANVLLIRVEGRIDHTTAKHFISKTSFYPS